MYMSWHEKQRAILLLFGIIDSKDAILTENNMDIIRCFHPAEVPVFVVDENTSPAPMSAKLSCKEVRLNPVSGPTKKKQVGSKWDQRRKKVVPVYIDEPGDIIGMAGSCYCGKVYYRVI